MGQEVGRWEEQRKKTVIRRYYMRKSPFSIKGGGGKKTGGKNESIQNFRKHIEQPLGGEARQFQEMPWLWQCPETRHQDCWDTQSACKCNVI